MTRFVTSVSPKGQVTIPVEIRREFGIDPQNQVVFEVKDGIITIQPTLANLRGFYRAVPAADQSLGWKEAERIAFEEAADFIASEGLPGN